MNTEEYIKCIRTKKRETQFVAMRQALCYYLYKENIPCAIIAEVMKMTSRNVYLAINIVTDLMGVGDRTINLAYEEIPKHTIRIAPCTVDGGILSLHTGYKMIIDNVIL